MTTGDSLLEKWFAAGDAGDVDAFDGLLHPEVVVQDVVIDGDLIAARAVVTGSLQHDFAGVVASGQRFRIDQGLFARVRDGRIVEAWEIVDTASLLRQLGAIPG